MQIDKPWGFELVLDDGEDYTFKVIRVKPGCRLSLQTHERKRETLLVLEGIMRLEVGPAVHRLVPFMHRTILAGEVHRIGCMGDDVLVFAEAATGGRMWDVTRHEDDYGRL
ncbi:hypothetical protein LCGC14_0801020 [marine sediment metagenome]|uniref:Mannose-6-phosphate isomerase type II C-terminal domain-containing protein n=1 Tax=marine sediment metagenome TaxID=412755 RepID=A0A0F9S9K4_9ZZZZ